MARYITLTVVYRGHALNRDEKIGGNILSIKKLTLPTGVHSFISRPAIRHYLFQTLVRMHDCKSPWQPAPVQYDNEVIQFDLCKANICTHAELDLFGYMYTISGQHALVRKAVIGITKAISLVPYYNDLAQYANHDLYRRALGLVTIPAFEAMPSQEGEIQPAAKPNPYTKEEHTTFYKVSFVIDLIRLGEDRLVFLGANSLRKHFGLPEQFENKPEKGKKAKPKEASLLEEEGEVKEETSGGKKKEAQEAPLTPEEIKIVADKISPQGGVCRVNVKAKNGAYVVDISLEPEEKKRRLEAVLEAIHDGLVAQSSGEANTLVPIFIAGAFVKVPCPILDPHIYWPPKKRTGSKEEKIEEPCFCYPIHPKTLENSWYINKMSEGGIYLDGAYEGCAYDACSEELEGERLSWQEFKERAMEAVDHNEVLVHSLGDE